MPGLPRWAEIYFSLACTEGGGTATRTEDDVIGWDYHVELPRKVYTGPAEGRPSHETAYVQVKSTVKTRPVATVKLSNIQLACASPLPWFLVVVSKPNTREHKLYGLHVWKETMCESLAACRRAHVNQIALHTTTISFSLPDLEPIEGDVVAWMRHHIDAVAGDYSTEKSRLFNTLGYENGFGTGTFTVVMGDEEDIVRAFLGVGDELNVSSFSITSNRFGIADRRSEEKGPGRIRIIPSPTGDCDLRLKSSMGHDSTSIKGLVYTYAPAIVRPEFYRMRIAAAPVEITIAASGSIHFSINTPTGSQYSLRQLQTIAQLSDWARAGSIDVSIRRKGYKTLAFAAKFERQNLLRSQASLSQIVTVLGEVLQYSSTEDVKFSIDEFHHAIRDLGYFVQINSIGSARLVCDNPAEYPSDLTSFIYHSSVSIGHWMIRCIVQRRIQSDRIVDGKRELTTGRPKYLLVKLSESENDELSVFEEEYQEIVEAFGETENPLSFGDMIGFVRSSNSLKR